MSLKWNFLTKICKNSPFYQHSQQLYDVMQIQNESLEFVQGVNFEYVDSPKNNGLKYLLTLDYSYGDIRNSKAFSDFATSGRHRGLSNFYIGHKMFHQSKLSLTPKYADCSLQIFP